MKTFRKKVMWGLAGLAIISSGCGEDFVSIDPKGVFLEENYYRNEEQTFSALVSVYDVLRKNSGGFENLITMMNAGSDDFFAGGGSPSDGAGIHGFDNFTINELNIPRSYLGDFYQGIARANILIVKLPDAEMNETTKARFLAEARALRAFYYFQLVNLFGNVPLITTPLVTSELFNVPQSNPTEIYPFIEAELLASINDIPLTIPAADKGRLSQGTVKAILGKVYLFQKKWTEAAAQLADVNGTPGAANQYGYKLMDSYNDLWTLTNKFNTESILETSHTDKSNAAWGNWGSSSDEGNSVNQMVGPRGYNRIGNVAPDYISGWSFNPVTQDLFTAMAGDPRFGATILDMKALVAAGQAGYSPADQDTGYFLKKFMPLKSETTEGGGTPELNYRQNTYMIRLADTYLMEAEAAFQSGNTGRAQLLLNAVRARVGLGVIPVSLDVIYQERRLELAGEGHRFFDLVRTGRTDILVPLGFTVGKNEILPLPFADIANTLLEQNPLY